jgi:hypothetical protein
VPSARAEYDFGEEQEAHAEPSSWHWNVDPDCDEENENDADVLLTVPDGPAVIFVSGGEFLAADAAPAPASASATAPATANTCRFCMYPRLPSK